MKRLVAVCSLLSSLCAAAGTTYYWTNGSGDKLVGTAGNWRLEDGSAATVAPGAGDTVVFTNYTGNVTGSGSFPRFYRYVFRDGAAPTFNGSAQIYWGAGGVSMESASGTVDFHYTTHPYGGTNVIDVVNANAMVRVENGFNFDGDPNEVIVKRGAGKFLASNSIGSLFANNHPELVVEGGYFMIRSKELNPRSLVGTKLTFNGNGGRFSFDYNYHFTNVVLRETAAVTTRTHGFSGQGTLHFGGADLSDIRFGGGFFGSTALDWDPVDDTRTFTFAGGTSDTDKKLAASRGFLRFEDGATVTKATIDVNDRVIFDDRFTFAGGTLNVAEDCRLAVSNGVQLTGGTVNLATGSVLAIGTDAGELLRPNTVTLATGARIVVDGETGVTSATPNTHLEKPTDFWPLNLTWNGEVELVNSRRFVNKDANWTYGPNASLKISGPTQKYFHVHGGQRTQVLSNYVETADAETTLTLTSYTAQHNIFRICGARDTRFTALIANTAMGTYALEWDPVDTTKTLTVAKQTFSWGRPRFRVKGGTMTFTEGACITTAFGTGVFVEGGATFAVTATAGHSFTTTTNVLADATAKIRLETGVVYAPAAVTVGGVAVPPGVYTRADFDWLEGDGVLVLAGAEGATTTATWTGGGATTALDDPANWGGTLPDLTNGTLVATIPAGFAACTVPNGFIRLKGLVATEPGFSLTGTGLLVLGSEGLVIPANTAKSYYDLAVRILLLKAQTWTIGDKSILRLQPGSGLISAVGGTALTLKGYVEFRAPNEGFTSGMNLVTGEAHAYAINCLGNVLSTFTQVHPTVLYLHGCALDSTLRVNGMGNTSTAYLQSRDGVNVLNGRVYVKEPNIGFFLVHGSSELRFRGGVQYNGQDDTGGSNNGAAWVPTGAFHIWVENKPVDIARLPLGCDDGNAAARVTECHLCVSSNRFSRGIILHHDVTAGNVLYTEVPYALYPDGTGGVSFHGNATKSTWDLCGCDQGVSVFFSRCVGAKVTSSAPATLHLVDEALNYVKTTEHDNGNMPYSILGTASQVDRTTFAGAANFSKEGQLTHYMMGVSTSTGSVSVAKGRLVFTKASAETVTLPQTTAITGYEKDGYVFTPLTGSWAHAAAVNVTGGTLELQHGRVFGKKTNIAVSGDGRLDLAAGVVQRCHALTLDGTPCATGTWGGPDSDADNKSAFLTGTGKLQVVGEGLGIVVIVK